jgi:site-specific recombinase XerD
MSQKLTVNQILSGFADYMTAERGFSRRTVKGYLEAVRYFTKQVGDLPIVDIGLNHFISLKARMSARGAGASWTRNVIIGMKCLLGYARDILKLPVLDLTAIRAPKLPRRQVTYLTLEEFEQFASAIRLRRVTGEPKLSGYCYRGLVETLFASGMRISEALALDRDSVDMERKEALIVGKGNKQRTVFFTDRALQWVTRYLVLRTDLNPALFVSLKNNRLTTELVHTMFRKTAKAIGLEKSVTPHIIRHTAATNLLRNGCPIGFIKEILGHERLETTCRYYLGIMSKADVKQAHELYSNLGPQPAGRLCEIDNRADEQTAKTGLNPSRNMYFPSRNHSPFERPTRNKT